MDLIIDIICSTKANVPRYSITITFGINNPHIIISIQGISYTIPSSNHRLFLVLKPI